MKTFSTLLLLPMLTTGLLLWNTQSSAEYLSTLADNLCPDWLKRRRGKLTEPSPDPEEEPTGQPDYHALMIRAARHYSFKNFPAALAYYHRVLIKYPNDMAALSGEAWSLYYMGQGEQAVKDFRALLEIDSHDSWALEGMALCHGKTSA